MTVGLWALLWALGMRGGVGIGLGCVAVAHFIHAREHKRRAARLPNGPVPERQRRAGDTGWPLLLARVRTFWTVVLSFVVILLAISAHNESERTHDALCTFRADLAHRVAQGRAYLEDHPEGFPGISPAELKRSIDGQARTVTALDSLDCS